VSPALRVIIVDERPERAALLEAALAEAGHRVVARLAGRADLAERVDELEPDVIVVDMECPDRDTLEDMSRISDRRPRPTVMFVDRSDSASIQAAVQAGVSAYVVGGLSAERVKSVLEVAIARFNEFQALRRELETARSSLAERKVIERAKGLLMERERLSEADAFARLRKASQVSGRPLRVIADAVLATFDSG
jgi:response regulator NasT